MTGAGFPHSEIHGSKLGRQLPVAYRSRPRPSSASAPRHPPLALHSLENKDARARFGILKGRRGTRTPRPDFGRSGTHGASGRRLRLQEAHAGIAGRTARKAAPSKRKSESPTPPAGAESVPGGLPGPEGLSSRRTWEAARHPPAYRRGRITSVQLGSGQSLKDRQHSLERR